MLSPGRMPRIPLRFAGRYFSVSFRSSYDLLHAAVWHAFETRVSYTPSPYLSKGPTGYTKPIEPYEDMKISLLSKLQFSASNFGRKLKMDFSFKEALWFKPRCPSPKIYVYHCREPQPCIEEGPSLEYVIADAIETPIGTLAEIFSVDLPNEIWTLVFEKLSQHDLPSCLRVSRKVCDFPFNPGVEHANMLVVTAVVRNRQRSSAVERPRPHKCVCHSSSSIGPRQRSPGLCCFEWKVLEASRSYLRLSRLFKATAATSQ